MTKQMKTETENKTGAESVAKKKKKTKAEITAANIAEGIERKQLSFPQWCAKWGFSDSTGRNMIKAGVGPVLSGVGRLVFVTVEDDAKWWGMWSQEGGRERFKQWSREQRKLRDERKAAAEELKKQQQGVPPQVPPADGAAAT